MRQEIHVPGLGPAISHYTEAVRFGDLVYMSGLVSWDAYGKVVAPHDAVGQTRQIFKIMKAILDEVGAGFEDVLKLNLFLTDINDRPLINPVRQEVFGDAKPASTLVQVAALVYPELCLEIESVVGIPSKR
jgi:2-iminobutanoate/2-iminopropanoate deaminase